MTLKRLAKGETLPDGFIVVDEDLPDLPSYTQAGPVKVTRVVDGVTNVTEEEAYTPSQLSGILAKRGKKRTKTQLRG